MPWCVLAVKVKTGGKRNIVLPNTFLRNSDRAARVLRRFICGKGVLARETIYHLQAPVDTFQLYQAWDVIKNYSYFTTVLLNFIAPSFQVFIFKLLRLIKFNLEQMVTHNNCIVLC